MVNSFISLENQYGTFHYQPLPVVLTHGQGVYVWDNEGKRYLDMMSAYSAVSHGHCHPKLVAALKEQAETLAMVSRAYYTDQLGPFLKYVCELLQYDHALPMNTGVEAVETAIKAARKWAYTIKRVAENQAEIITCAGNFHGRTTTAISMSSEPAYREGFGPFAPGFKIIPYNDTEALENAITANTAAFLIEPIQGEGGIQVPDKGYLKRCEEICKKHHVLLIADEVQTGLGRTGKWLASHHENVKPDIVILGKALGGGLLPVSLILGNSEIMSVFTPGSHGSTFGGNPLAAKVAYTALKVLKEDHLIENADELGAYFFNQLSAIHSPLIKEVRGKGLLLGIELNPNYSAREICLKLLKKGLLSKDTHHTVLRFAPPLIITREEIDAGLAIIQSVLTST